MDLFWDSLHQEFSLRLLHTTAVFNFVFPINFWKYLPLKRTAGNYSWDNYDSTMQSHMHHSIFVILGGPWKMQQKFKKENKQNHQRYWNHILCPDSMGHVLSIIKLLSFLWIKSFKWYVLGSWTFLTCKKRRENHSYPFCNFNRFHEVLFYFLHKFFLTQCNAMSSYLISPLHSIHNG